MEHSRTDEGGPVPSDDHETEPTDRARDSRRFNAFESEEDAAPSSHWSPFAPAQPHYQPVPHPDGEGPQQAPVSGAAPSHPYSQYATSGQQENLNPSTAQVPVVPNPQTPQRPAQPPVQQPPAQQAPQQAAQPPQQPPAQQPPAQHGPPPQHGQAHTG